MRLLFSSSQSISNQSRLALRFVVLASLFLTFGVGNSLANNRPIPTKPSRDLEVIDQAEGIRRMAAFRSQRLEGDYCFRFVLEHLPRRGPTVSYQGTLWGSWNERGPVSRLHINETSQNDLSGANKAVEIIIQNGLLPEAWIRQDGNAAFSKIESEAVFLPLFEGILFSAFDLQMPFIYWPDFKYEGPVRIQSRVAQQFLMAPPVGSAAASKGVKFVRIALDDTYDAMLRVEVVEAEGETRSRFTVESFKKVQGQYIVKEITLKDFISRDRTRFAVKAASVGLDLDEALFDPRGTGPLPIIPESSFSRL